MANPVFIDCPAGQWTKVATDVTTGQIHRADMSPGKYLQTYRDTGGEAPTSQTEGVPVFVGGIAAEISATVGVDIYIFPVGAAGRVRIDL